MLSFLKKLFGLGSSNTADYYPQPVGGDEDLVQLVKFVVVRMVDEPGEVQVRGEDNDKGFQITVKCNQSDIGKIIGKAGKNIQALRALVSGAGVRGSRRVSVEIED